MKNSTDAVKQTKTFRLTIRYQDKNYSLKISQDTDLLSAMRELPEVPFDAPCGGKGTCGKCAVLVNSGELSAVSSAERKFLDQKELDAGIRLACQAYPESDCSISITRGLTNSQILDDTQVSDFSFTPLYSIHTCSLEEPSTEDQRPLIDRLCDICSHENSSSPGETKAEGTKPGETKAGKTKVGETKVGETGESFGSSSEGSMEKAISLLPSQIREASSDFHKKTKDTGYGSHPLTILKRGRTIIDVRDQPEEYVGFAVDIGTTTVVAYTIGLLTGSILTFRSAMNRQKTYGADVISRIQYSQEYKDGLHKMHKAITTQLQELFDDMLKQLSLKRESVVDIAIAGNTTMLHLFADIDPSGIAAAPFIPVFTRSLSGRASDFAFKFPPATSLQLLPSVASYIGADITAGMLTTKLLDNGKNKMLLDIGTNGEIALSKDGHIFCCSSAAGPAFEGANITFGVGGIFGAIDSVKIIKKKQTSAEMPDESKDSFFLEYTSIGDKPAVGICGSAIIDITAVLLDLGLVDFTGRIDDSREEYAHLLTNYQDQPAVIIAPASETADGKSILFTQKDIREVQLAKSAIAAGIQTLLHESGTDPSQISSMHIAGGFGNYIHVPSAVRIGLIPSELENKTKAAGNTAGRGAVQFLIDKYAAEECRDILGKTRYIELSSNTAFQNFYIEQMVFPE